MPKHKAIIKSSDRKTTPGSVGTQRELAQIFNRSVRTIKDWVANGMPVCPDGDYNPLDIQKWRDSLLKKEVSNEENDVRDQPFYWQLKYVVASNKATELKKIVYALPDRIESLIQGNGEQVKSLLLDLRKQIKNYEKQARGDLRDALQILENKMKDLGM
jgi:hypothetical protein